MATHWHGGRLDDATAQVLAGYASRNGVAYFCDACRVPMHDGEGCLGHTYDTTEGW